MQLLVYQRLLEYVKPDYVHVFVNGNIVETGGVELSEKLEKERHEELIQKLKQLSPKLHNTTDLSSKKRTIRQIEIGLALIIVTPNPITYLIMPLMEIFRSIYSKLIKKSFA